MRDHKSLRAWQHAHSVAVAAVEIAKNHWQPAGDAVFAQLRRASLSVQLNIAEGHALRSTPRFRYHLSVAYGSAVETLELIELATETNLLPQIVSQPLREDAMTAQALVLGLLRRYSKTSSSST